MPNNMYVAEVRIPGNYSYNNIYVLAPNMDLAEEAVIEAGYNLSGVFDEEMHDDGIVDVTYQTNPARYAAAMLKIMLYSGREEVTVPLSALDQICSLMYALFGDNPEDHPDYQAALEDWEAR